MPIMNLECPGGHKAERYYHSRAHVYLEVAITCGCGLPYLIKASFGTPLLYFSEKRPRYIDNLQATVRSHGEHQRIMKERGVEPALDWHVSRKVSDGLKTKAEPEHPRSKMDG